MHLHLPDENSEAQGGNVPPRIAWPLCGQARTGPGYMALHVVLKGISAVRAAGFQGGGNFQSGLGRGTQGIGGIVGNCGALSHLLPA